MEKLEICGRIMALYFVSITQTTSISSGMLMPFSLAVFTMAMAWESRLPITTS